MVEHGDPQSGNIELTHLIDVGLWQSMLDSLSAQLEAGITLFNDRGEVILRSRLAALCDEAMKREGKHPACFRCCEIEPVKNDDRGEFALCPYCDRMINFGFNFRVDSLAGHVVVGPVWIAEKETPATLTRLARRFGISQAKFTQLRGSIRDYSLEEFRRAGEMVQSTMRVACETLATSLELASEVGELKQSLLLEKRKTWQQMVRDKQTGAYRYHYGLSRLKEEVARAERYKQSLSIVVIGFAQYRSYVDRYGPTVVSTILGNIGKLIYGGSRRTDVPVRLREEEFLLVLPFTAEKGAKAVLERMEEEIRSLGLLTEDGGAIEPPALVDGVASYPQDGANERDLLRKALSKVRE
ncbi:MAG: diguanylate cyclase [bacterium]|nr:diguanylate cyclase [bacterium]